MGRLHCLGTHQTRPLELGCESNIREGVPLLLAGHSEELEKGVPLMDSSLFQTVGLKSLYATKCQPFLPRSGKGQNFKSLAVTQAVWEFPLINVSCFELKCQAHLFTTYCIKMDLCPHHPPQNPHSTQFSIR